MKTIQKKEVEDIQGFILSIVGIGVVLAVGLIVLGQLRSNIATTNAGDGCNSTVTTNCGAAYNGTSAIAQSMSTIPNWIGILITVALAFIVLGYFYNR